MKQYNIEFEYAYNASNYEWRKQSCILSADNPHLARKKCIELYGLGYDCEYRITKIEEV